MQSTIKRIVTIVLLLAMPALAVRPSHWTHSTEADFRQGKMQNTVTTNLGDIKLAREVQTLVEEQPRISAVYSLAQTPDGAIYAGTGPEGVLLRIRDGEVQTVLELGSGVSIFSLLVDGDALLIGASGERGRVLRLDNPGQATPQTQPVERFSADGVQYIWAMLRTLDGNVYLGTGPEGQLFELTPDGGSRVVLQTDEANFLSLASDGKEMLYVGTDPNGLIYRVNRRTGEMFVLFDAAESEISTLVMGSDGNLYAGTGQAVDSGGDISPAGEQTGRPEIDPSGVPIPAQPPENPQPPEVPDPNPGEPDPIPTNPQARAWDGMSRQAAAVRRLTELGYVVMPQLQAVGVVQAGNAANLQEDAPDAPAEAEPAEAVEAEGDEAQGTARGGLPSPARSEPPAEGNAIYRIDPDGFVSEIFRESVLVLSMIEQDGTLLVGTGSEGRIYQIRPNAEEVVVLADLESEQVLCLLNGKDGRTYIGMANIGGVAAMSSGYAAEGTYISPVLDASQVARFGKIDLQGTLPEGTRLQVSTRSGNMAEPDDRTWSPWSQPKDASRFMDIDAPPARFLQYRLILTSNAGRSTPVVDEVDVAYQIPNLAPRITAIMVTRNEPEGDGANPRTHTIAWEATDPNEDALKYTLSFRLGRRGPWIPLAKDLTEATYTWNTGAIADGRYYVQVVASDAAANALGEGKTASRISEAVVVDNTPPVIGDLTWQKQPGGVRVNLRVVDRTSTVDSVAYTVDASDDWQAVLPSDKMFDSPAETVSFVIPGLQPGQHQVTIRATDAHGNRSLEHLLVTVDAEAND